MTTQSVCAVIVTYHPGAGMVENLFTIFSQVSGMVVVDNGSNPDELDALRTASRNPGFQLIENGENLGIAEALNQGVRCAVGKGYPWVILFDQDSRITDNFVENMLLSWRSHPERERIGAIHPKYLDVETGLEARVWRAKDGGPVKSMTSGALIPVWIFEKLGWFATEFFIDNVDTEFCFRIRAAGYFIADSRAAILRHSSGTPQPVTIFGFTFRPSYHSVARRYYMSRNRIVICRKYFRIFPRWIAYYSYECLRETVKCFIGEPDRVHKFRNFLLGAWDGLTGRMGKRANL